METATCGNPAFHFPFMFPFLFYFFVLLPRCVFSLLPQRKFTGRLTGYGTLRGMKSSGKKDRSRITNKPRVNESGWTLTGPTMVRKIEDWMERFEVLSNRRFSYFHSYM